MVDRNSFGVRLVVATWWNGSRQGRKCFSPRLAVDSEDSVGGDVGNDGLVGDAEVADVDVTWQGVTPDGGPDLGREAGEGRECWGIRHACGRPGLRSLDKGSSGCWGSSLGWY